MLILSPSSLRSVERGPGTLLQRGSVRRHPVTSEHQLREDLRRVALRQRTAGCAQTQRVHFSESLQFQSGDELHPLRMLLDSTNVSSLVIGSV